LFLIHNTKVKGLSEAIEDIIKSVIVKNEKGKMKMKKSFRPGSLFSNTLLLCLVPCLLFLEPYALLLVP
jgi:hypothetical protein